MFDTRLLKTFLAVAEHKHFGEAAKSVHATQPGVSQHIARLEEQIGFRLFERTKRSVVLTAAGEAFYHRSRHLAAMMDRMVAEGLQIDAGYWGRVAVGMQSSVLYTDIPARIASFKKRFPTIALTFEVHPGDFLRDKIDAGELDLALTSLPLLSTDYHARPIARQRMGVAVPKVNPLSAARELTLSDLKDERFIVVPRKYDPVGHDLLIAKMLKLGAALDIAGYETPSLNVLVRVALEEGVALVPLGYQQVQHKDVQIVPLVDDDLGMVYLYAALHKDNMRPATAKLIASLASEYDEQ